MKTKETLQNKIDLTIKQLEALTYAKHLTEKKHSEALDMVENCPQNIYIDEWKHEAERTARHLEALDQVADMVAKEQSALFDDLERAEQGKPQKVALMLDPISARLVADILDFNVSQLEEAERRDPLRDNNYLINACKDFLKAYEGAK